MAKINHFLISLSLVFFINECRAVTMMSYLCPDEVEGNTPPEYARFAHEYDCTLYHMCHQGLHTINQCPDGTGFRVIKYGMGECDIIGKVQNCAHKAFSIME